MFTGPLGPQLSTARFARTRRAAAAGALHEPHPVVPRQAPPETPTLDARAQATDTPHLPVPQHFIYVPVQKNGRRGAKRTPQGTDIHWASLVDRLG